MDTDSITTAEASSEVTFQPYNANDLIDFLRPKMPEVGEPVTTFINDHQLTFEAMTHRLQGKLAAHGKRLAQRGEANDMWMTWMDEYDSAWTHPFRASIVGFSFDLGAVRQYKANMKNLALANVSSQHFTKVWTGKAQQLSLVMILLRSNCFPRVQ